MLTRILSVITVLAIVFAFAAPASGDWDLGDPHKMHWPQLPNLTPEGLDVLAGLALEPFPAPVIKFLADDFRCSQTGPITDIHVWGSWLDDFWPDPGVAPGAHGTFILGLYDDVPAGQIQPWSMPGNLLWQQAFKPGEYQARIYEDAPEEFFDPNINQIIGVDNTVWQYNFFIDEALALVQEEGKIYWLAVANVDPNNDGIIDLADLNNAAAGQYRFGWKTSGSDQFQDDAVFLDIVDLPIGLPPEVIDPPFPNPDWKELRDPRSLESLDLAFVITPEPATLALLAIGAIAVLRRR